MDIAKYIITAVILATVFGSITAAWVVYLFAAATTLLTLCGGLWLLRDDKRKE